MSDSVNRKKDHWVVEERIQASTLNLYFKYYFKYYSK